MSYNITFKLLFFPRFFSLKRNSSVPDLWLGLYWTQLDLSLGETQHGEVSAVCLCWTSQKSFSGRSSCLAHLFAQPKYQRYGIKPRHAVLTRQTEPTDGVMHKELYLWNILRLATGLCLTSHSGNLCKIRASPPLSLITTSVPVPSAATHPISHCDKWSLHLCLKSSNPVYYCSYRAQSEFGVQCRLLLPCSQFVSPQRLAN